MEKKLTVFCVKQKSLLAEELSAVGTSKFNTQLQTSITDDSTISPKFRDMKSILQANTDLHLKKTILKQMKEKMRRPHKNPVLSRIDCISNFSYLSSCCSEFTISRRIVDCFLNFPLNGSRSPDDVFVSFKSPRTKFL